MLHEPQPLFEDNSVLVIVKPAGLLVHSDARGDELTLVDWLLKTRPEINGVGEREKGDDDRISRPGIVHRLDRETSGVMVVAKTLQAFHSLKQQFRDRRVKKTYRAFVYGIVREDRGIVDVPIGTSRSDVRVHSASRTSRGKKREARTVFVTLGRGSGATYLQLMPKTGRTHQLRVHMKHIGHPIVCDSLYAPGRACILGFQRTALHAHTLAFEHPDTGTLIAFEAPLPDDFVAALAQFGGV